MRFAYLDESGMASYKHDKFAVMAAVLVNGDKQLIPVSRHVSELFRNRISEDYVPGVFHARDLYRGEGRFTKDIISREDRIALFEELFLTTREYQLPVILGIAPRPDSNARDHKAVSLLFAAIRAVLEIEAYMRTQSDEVCMLVYEDNDLVRKGVREMHDYFRSDKCKLVEEIINTGVIPFERIVEPAQFAEKSQSALLQLADIVAFSTKRLLSREEYFFDLFYEIEDNVINAKLGKDEVREGNVADFRVFINHINDGPTQIV